MNYKNKEKNVLYINHKGELLIWLIVILFFVSLSSAGFIFKEKNDKNDYQIFLQDVDGLIVGSPVRMMGVEVGHVTKIKPIKDEVYVKFVLTNPDIYIPQGTAVTIEFSGMAGSKSLELYLPNEDKISDNNIPLISVLPPKRLHDALGLLNEMFEKIGTIIYTTSSFGAKLEVENLLPEKQVYKDVNARNFLNYSDRFLDDSNNKAVDIRKSLERLRKHAK